MANHTPGPWEVRDNWYIGIAGDPFSLAEVKSCNTIPASETETHKANARLIAAAPDLLEAAKKASDALADDGCDHNCLCKCSRCQTIDLLEAAIAKAEKGG